MDWCNYLEDAQYSPSALSSLKLSLRIAARQWIKESLVGRLWNPFVSIVFDALVCVCESLKVYLMCSDASSVLRDVCWCWPNNSWLGFYDNFSVAVGWDVRFPRHCRSCRFSIVCLWICLLWVVVDFWVTCWRSLLCESIGWRSVTQSPVAHGRTEVNVAAVTLEQFDKKTLRIRGNATNKKIITNLFFL